MNIIKLDAIDSTNDFLKKMASMPTTENYTIVTAENQINGKGQFGSKWVSEKGKNLIFSVLIKNVLPNYKQIFDVNIAVAVALFEALKSFEIPDLSIKWANDILSGNKKIAGVLIENIIKENNSVFSIIGIGINVNQTKFDNLPQASSLKNCTHKDFDREQLLHKIIDSIEQNICLVQDSQSDKVWEKYHRFLFRKSIPTVFENNKQQKFMGLIQGVTRLGKLVILLENDIMEEFEIKEIKMLY